MKLFHDYKKLFNSESLRLSLVVILFFIFTSVIFAETATDIQNKISQKDSDIASLEQEIKAYQFTLDSIGKQKDSLNRSLQELDLNRKKLNADISLTQKKIDKTNLKIQNLSSDINTKQDYILNNLDSLKIGLKNINEYEQSNIVNVLFSKEKFTDSWNDIENIVTLSASLRADIKSLKEVKGQLEDTKKVTISAKDELVKLKSQLNDQQKIVLQNTDEKNKLLKQTKNSEANYQTLLKDRIQKRDAFEKELRDYEAQLKFILDPSKLPNSGVLSWPLEKVYVTQLFGRTVDSKRLYASGSHNGVDFRASVGTPILAMADGVVRGTGNTDTTCYAASFGKFVFIEYNNGLSSTFGHLSLIKVNEGDTVKRGQVVAYSGNTGHTTGPHLHVSLYASQAVKMDSKASAACGGRNYRLPVAPVNAYLDAMYYLPSYTVNSFLLNSNASE